MLFIFHHEYPESHECFSVLRFVCFVRFVLFIFHPELLESHECSIVYNSCDSRDSYCLSFTTNISNLTNAAVFLIRVIRAIRVVYLHHELLESHECSCVYNSCDSCDSCCFPFTTNIPNLTNVAVF